MINGREFVLQEGHEQTREGGFFPSKQQKHPTELCQ